MKEYIQKLTQNHSLKAEEAEIAISKIFTEATDAQIVAFLTDMKHKLPCCRRGINVFRTLKGYILLSQFSYCFNEAQLQHCCHQPPHNLILL